MSKDDIDKAVKEAEQFAADDKKKREEVDIRNGADQMVFQTEKMLKENGDKMPADVKSEAEAKLAELKTAVQSGSIDDIKAKQDALSHVFEKMYQAAAAAQQQAAGAQPGPDAGANGQQKPNDDGVVDADFKEVLFETQQCVSGQTGGYARRRAKAAPVLPGRLLLVIEKTSQSR